VELLVVICIIAMLSSVVLAALAKTRELAKADATKATIAKLNDLIMRKYESYLTRRVPLNLSGLTPPQAAQIKLYAIRDLMRMEMPERWSDFQNGPLKYTTTDGKVSMTLANPPSMLGVFKNKLAAAPINPVGKDHAGAKCLYMWVMAEIPDAKTLFNSSEIGTPDNDGWKTFIDGWGNPICWFRWAPGASGYNGTASYSDIQIADPVLHHDPLDYRNVDSTAYQLFPLIYAGVISKDTNGDGNDDYGISAGPLPTASVPPSYTPCSTTANQNVGSLMTGVTSPRFTNHHITSE
jgi:type II secretory pathway pseudopilin PulG